jgi:hypothetical protein
MAESREQIERRIDELAREYATGISVLLKIF